MESDLAATEEGLSQIQLNQSEVSTPFPCETSANQAENEVERLIEMYKEEVEAGWWKRRSIVWTFEHVFEVFLELFLHLKFKVTDSGLQELIAQEVCCPF